MAATMVRVRISGPMVAAMAVRRVRARLASVGVTVMPMIVIRRPPAAGGRSWGRMVSLQRIARPVSRDVAMCAMIRAGQRPRATAAPRRRAIVVRRLRVSAGAVGRALVAITVAGAAPPGSRLSVGLRLGLTDLEG